MIPPGRLFDPSDGEIVSYYLPKLIQGNGNLGFLGDFSYFFDVCDVYSAKPSILFDLPIDIPNSNDHNMLLCHPCLKRNQRFFFSNREKIAHKNANGKRPRRTLHHERYQENGEGGFWKSSTGEKPIFDDDHKLILGYVNMLNFYDYNNQSSSHEKKNRKDATKSSWIMYEYQLPGDRFQEWVVCKIKDTCRGEEDRREAFWLDQLFSDRFQTLPAQESSTLPQQMPMQAHEFIPSCQPLTNNLVDLPFNIDYGYAGSIRNIGEQAHDGYPSCQPLSNNLAAPQAEAVPFNIDYGYAGLIRTGEQGGDMCISHRLMAMETRPDEDDDGAAEARRFALELEEVLEVESVWNDGILASEYGSQAETESLQQQQQSQENGYFIIPYKSVSNSELVEEAPTLQEADGYINGSAREEQSDMNMVKPSSIENGYNLQQQMQAHDEYPSMQPLCNNLVPLQAEFVPFNIGNGYARSIRNTGEQGRDICINHPLMETETKPDEDDNAESTRFALELEEMLGVESVSNDGILASEYGSQAEQESLQQQQQQQSQEEGYLINPYESVSTSELVGEVPALEEADGYDMNMVRPSSIEIGNNLEQQRESSNIISDCWIDRMKADMDKDDEISRLTLEIEEGNYMPSFKDW